MAGRRWEPIFYLITEETSTPDVDRIVTMPPAVSYPERRYQYRVAFDHTRQAWRVDMRVDVGPSDEE